jgi:hypothetical protein
VQRVLDDLIEAIPTIIFLGRKYYCPHFTKMEMKPREVE